MRRHPLLTVAGLVATALLLAFGLHRLRSWSRAAAQAANRLPAEGLIAGIGSEDLGARLEDLERLPVYRALRDREFKRRLRGTLGWRKGTLDPWEGLPTSGSSALGLYRDGWIVVHSGPWEGPAGAPSRQDGPWRLTASDGALLLAPDGVRSAGPAPSGRAGIAARLDLRALLSGPGSRGNAAQLARILPRQAEGIVEVHGASVSERWTLDCGGACVLDLLARSGVGRAEAAGWSALPEDPKAVAWCRLDPERLAAWCDAAQEETAPGFLRRLAQLERFLGFPFRSELAGVLAGPVVFGVLDAPEGEPPRALLALDVVSPEKAEKLLGRAAALGVLSGAVTETTYRGVPVASWVTGRRRGSWEPAAAVDGNVLLVASRRKDLEDAIDRRKEASSGGRRAGGPPPSIANLRGGSWRGTCDFPVLWRAWERLLGISATSLPPSPSGVSAVLRAENGRWVLEGSGPAPSFCADPMLPTLRALARYMHPPGKRAAPGTE